MKKNSQRNKKSKKYFFVSLALHAGILFLLLFSVNFSSPHFVIENTAQHDVISAVILGNTPKSKMLPQKPPIQNKDKLVQHEQDVKTSLPRSTSQIAPSKPIATETTKEAIALQPIKKKKINQKSPELLQKELLADMSKEAEKAEKVEKAEKNKKRKQVVKQKKLRSTFENALKEQAENSLRQSLLDEKINLQGTTPKMSQGEVNKYKALIVQAISEHWVVPHQSDKKLYCELMIRLAPGGMVLSVQITHSSGDPSLDRSARAAVLKASPLPVPDETDRFDAFRQFVLKVKPENVVEAERLG